MTKGTIKRLRQDRGFGFIQPDGGGKDVFFHFSELVGDPVEGQRVEFDVVMVEKGPRARNLMPLDAGNSYRFLNPYNFVRNLQKAREGRHVLGSCPPPPHDRYVGLTGRIACDAEVITSLFISDSHAVREADRHRSYRFFQYDGRPAVPASSLRGMIRAVFEAVTNSCFVVFRKDEPYPLEHRKAHAPDMVPARVISFSEEGGVCLELLDCTINPPVSIQGYPPVVKAGAVTKAYPPRVLVDKKAFNPDDSKLPSGSYDGMRVVAIVTKEPLVHNSKRFRFFQVVSVRPKSEHESLVVDSEHIKVFGWLHMTGPNIENKHDERLFFRWDDRRQPDPPGLEDIPPVYLCDCGAEVVREYNHHLDDYWERLGRRVEELGDQRWPNSNKDVPQPSSFVEKGRRLKVGDLVYVQRNGEGKGIRLRPVSIPRLPYKHCREDFLPVHLARRESYNDLCPACRVFGWVHENAGKASTDQLTAYASRVRFSHGLIEGAPQTEKEITLAILSTPKPTTTPFYLLDSKGEPDPIVTYDTDGARLRGRKIYRDHGKVNFSECKSDTKSDQNRTVYGALKPGAKFTFSIDFENLAPSELGALLYVLELEDDMVHRLGYAKPLGFGSVKVNVKKVETINWKTRLASADPNAGWEMQDEGQQAELKQTFLNEMHTFYGSEFAGVLADLQALLGTPPGLPVHYPRPTKRLNQDKHPQYEWFVGNNKRIEKKVRNKTGLPVPVPLDLASDDKIGLPLIDKNGGDVLGSK